MMRKLAILILLAQTIYAAPAPYPLVADSQSASRPALTARQANGITYRVTFRDGGQPVSLTSVTPYMIWATGLTSTAISQATPSIVNSASGIVDFVWSPSALNTNIASGVWEVGLQTAGIPRTYTSGAWQIMPDPYASGAPVFVWTTNSQVVIADVDWSGAFPVANIPNLPQYVPTNRVLTINGTAYSLDADRSWTVTAVEADTLQTIANRGRIATNDFWQIGGLNIGKIAVPGRVLLAGSSDQSQNQIAIATTTNASTFQTVGGSVRINGSEVYISPGTNASGFVRIGQDNPVTSPRFYPTYVDFGGQPLSNAVLSETEPAFNAFTNTPDFNVRPTVNGTNVLLAGEASAQTQQVYSAQAGTVVGVQSNTIANAITNFNDTIHGERGGANLHALADGSGAGFLSALQYGQVVAMVAASNAWSTAYGWGNHATNGYVTQTITNGLASETRVVAATNDLDVAISGRGYATNGQPVTLAQLPSHVLTNGALYLTPTDTRAATLPNLTQMSNVWVTATGVGIGTNAPATTLDVNGDTTVRGSVKQNTAASTNYFAGRTGIGTASPAYPFVVSASGGMGLEFGTSGGLGAGPFIQSYDRTTSQNSNLTFYAKDYRFYNSTTAKEVLTTSGGSVGIGTNAPATTLDVNGAATIRGNVNVSGYNITGVNSATVSNLTAASSITLGGEVRTNWHDSAGYAPLFHAYNLAATSYSPAAWSNIANNAIVVDTHGGFSTNTYKYTIPRTGYWLFTAEYGIGAAGTGTYYIRLIDNLAVVKGVGSAYSVNAVTPRPVISAILYMTNNATIQAQVYSEVPSTIYGNNSGDGFIQGQWLHF